MSPDDNPRFRRGKEAPAQEKAPHEWPAQQGLKKAAHGLKRLGEGKTTKQGGRLWFGIGNGGGDWSNVSAASIVEQGTPPEAHYVASLANGSTQGVENHFGLPTDIAAGSSLSVSVVWRAAGTDASAHSVVWTVNAKSLISGASTTATGTTTQWTGSSGARTIGDLVVEPSQQILSSVGLYSQEIIRLNISRVGGDAADTYNTTAGFMGAWIVYTVDPGA